MRRAGWGAPLVAVAVAVSVALAAGACATGPPLASNAVPPPAAGEDRTVYVAMGSDETLNRGIDDSLRRAWTQQVFTNALGTSAVYTNLATADATVREGLSEQLPKALDVRPTLVTIWFGDGDARSHTTDGSFISDLTDIVTQLQANGTTKVLLLSRTDPGAGNDSRYADDVKGVASATGATFVPITGLRNFRDPATQQSIADAVTPQIRN